ncbi:MAG: Ig-like domain-containing protein, partial [Gemmatimonadaceae bacterium]
MLKAAGAALAVGIATLCGCERRSDTITGLHPTQIVTAGGEDQIAFVAHPLTFPLAVIVKNSDGSPAPGISVKWEASGGGTISGSSGLTDSDGRV